MASNPHQIMSADLFFFYHAPKSFNKPFEFLLYKTNRLHFSVRVYCNRSQKTSQSVKNNSHTTWLCLVSYFLFFIHGGIICDLLQYTHTWKNVIYLLNNCTLVLCEKSVVQFDSARHNRFLWTNCFFYWSMDPCETLTVLDIKK